MIAKLTQFFLNLVWLAKIWSSLGLPIFYCTIFAASTHRPISLCRKRNY